MKKKIDRYIELCTQRKTLTESEKNKNTIEIGNLRKDIQSSMAGEVIEIFKSYDLTVSECMKILSLVESKLLSDTVVSSAQREASLNEVYRTLFI